MAALSEVDHEDEEMAWRRVRLEWERIQGERQHQKMVRLKQKVWLMFGGRMVAGRRRPGVIRRRAPGGAVQVMKYDQEFKRMVRLSGMRAQRAWWDGPRLEVIRSIEKIGGRWREYLHMQKLTKGEVEWVEAAAPGLVWGKCEWGGDVDGGSKSEVVLRGELGKVVDQALFDTGARVSVMTKRMQERGGWALGESLLKGLTGITKGSRTEVVGVVCVDTEVAGVRGSVTYAVVPELPSSLPEVVIGRSAVMENRWVATLSPSGLQIQEQAGVMAAVGVVSVVDEAGKEEVVYDSPAFEDAEHEEDGEEVDYMPPPELDEDQVKKEMKEIMKQQKHLSKEVKVRLLEMLQRRWRAFSNRIGGVKGHEFRVDTGSAEPVAKKPFRFPPEKRMEIGRQVKDLLERGLIELCTSPWCTNPVLAKKKDGTYRMAIDYRALNAVTVSDEYPIPSIDDIIDEMGQYRVFTTVDMRSGFWQLPLHAADRDKTAFATPGGLYRWKVMPFGLKNATGAFQRMMMQVLRGMKGVKVYVDDVIIGTKSEEGHLELVEAVLKRLEEAGLVCKLNKSEFMQREVEVLGFTIGGGKVQMQERLVGKVRECKVPTTRSEVRQFVGLVGFYRHFIADFASKAAPLTDVMGVKSEWVWEDRQQRAYEELRDEVLGEKVLRVPDYAKEFVIHTDASGIGVGAALMQRDEEGRLYACRFYSRKLNAAERKYSATEREYLAMVLALKKWRKYLGVRTSEVHTDHKPLLSMVKATDESQSARVQRWGMLLQSFDVRIRYIKGKQNVVADALSRELFVGGEEDGVVQEERELLELVEAAVVDMVDDDEWEHEEAQGQECGDGAAPGAVAGCPGELGVTSQGAVERYGEDGEWVHEEDEVVEVAAAKELDECDPVKPGKEKLGVGVVDEGWTDLGKSDVPGEGSLGVEKKGEEQEEKLELEYWEEVKADQRRDRECAEWIARVKDGEVVRQEGGELELDEDGLLHLRDRQGRVRLVIPCGEKREELLRLVHENRRDGGHFSAVKGASKLQQRWWWPGMVADLRHWVRTCRLCQVYKHARGRGRLPQDTPRVVPRGPWDSVYVDAVGPLGRGRGGYSYCLVAIDHFTRYVEVMPARRLTTESYVGWLQQLVARYGTMRRLTSDRGSNFISALVEAYCRVMGIDRHSTTAWRPTANSLVERYNGELKDRFRTMCEEVGPEWPNMVDDFASVHNSTVHSATGFTPHFLMHGWEMKLPYDLLVDGKLRAMHEPVEVQKWVEQFVRLVSDARSAARQQQGDRDRKQQLREVIIAKTLNPPPVFEVGQQVLLDKRYRGPGQKKEATVLWTGPYYVTQKVSDVVYEVEREGGRLDLVHVDRMKRWHEPIRDPSRFTQRSEQQQMDGVEEQKTGFEDLDGGVEPEGGDGVESSDEDVEEEGVPDEDLRARELAENEYEVEAILQKRISPRTSSRLVGPQVEYLVKWKNWDDQHNSWERAENLGNSRKLVREFEDTQSVEARNRRAYERAIRAAEAAVVDGVEDGAACAS